MATETKVLCVAVMRPCKGCGVNTIKLMCHACVDKCEYKWKDVAVTVIQVRNWTICGHRQLQLSNGEWKP